MSFADHFSGHAADYAKSRPTYPAELFDWLAVESPSTGLAWDCATGNGQAALELATRFDRVVATDGSADQLASARAHLKVDYVRALAEHTPLADASIDLCAVAQAAHWFDLDAFASGLRRVARPGALVAMWCYTLFRVDDRVDAIVDELYGPILGEYWPPRRHHIETEYRELDLPFPAVDAPAFTMVSEWDADEVLGYLGTWSSARRHAVATGEDAVARIAGSLRDAWGEDPRRVTWPIHLRAFRP